jgi:hypothetical protein
LSLMILAATSIVALMVLMNKVHKQERISNSLRDIFRDFH